MREGPRGARSVLFGEGLRGGPQPHLLELHDARGGRRVRHGRRGRRRRRGRGRGRGGRRRRRWWP
eukprot:scaffold19057_cov48-Phaeocystis_antarctica.AAC.2